MQVTARTSEMPGLLNGGGGFGVAPARTPVPTAGRRRRGPGTAPGRANGRGRLRLARRGRGCAGSGFVGIVAAGVLLADPATVEPAAERARPRRSPVRLTRRGRMVILALLVLLAAAVAALAALPSQAAAPAAPARVVVVRPGDSLWSIVERYRPGGDPRRAMDELRDANQISGSTLYPGEELNLPARW